MDGEKKYDMFTRFDTNHKCDKQTDGQTKRMAVYSIYRACMASSGKILGGS